MGTLFVPVSVAGGVQSQTSLNTNFTNIQTALGRLLNVYGDATSGVNALQVNMDANGKRILNLGAPVGQQDAARLADVSAVVAAGLPDQTSNANKFIQTDGTAATWVALTETSVAAIIKTAYESNADTNEYSDSEQTKLAGIETAATIDQTGAEIKTAYEAEANTNAFTDALLTKLNAIASGAEVNQNTFTTIQVATQSDVVADAKTDTLTLVAGAGTSITTNAGTDTITITNTTTGVTNGDSHDHNGGDGATIPVAGGGTGATTTNAAKEALGIYHGRVDYDASTIRLPAGWSCATSADDLVVTHNLGTANYSVTLMGVDTGGSTLSVNCNNVGTNSFTIEIDVTLAVQHEFHFVLITD